MRPPTTLQTSGIWLSDSDCIPRAVPRAEGDVAWSLPGILQMGCALLAPSTIHAVTKTFVKNGFAGVSEPRALELGELCLAGHERALEVILSSQDCSGADVERLRMVSQALPDAELDGFVRALPTRLTCFKKQSLSGAKAQVERRGRTVIDSSVWSFFSTTNPTNP